MRWQSLAPQSVHECGATWLLRERTARPSVRRILGEVSGCDAVNSCSPTLAATSALALPAVARAQAASVLKFIPQADLAVTDPVWTTADVTRNHAFMVYDTLYGLDAQLCGQAADGAGAYHLGRRQAVGPDAARRAEIP